MRTLLSITIIAATMSVAMAQRAPAPKTPRNESLYISDAQLREIMQKSPASYSSRLIADTTHSTAFIRLAKPDVPHAHGKWSEVFVIKEGSAILETNGKITGITGTNSATHGAIFTDADGKPREQAAPPPPTAAELAAQARRAASGDLAGTAIEGGTQQRVGPGDVVLIPAGVPHRWLQVDQPIVYLDIKFPKAE